MAESTQRRFKFKHSIGGGEKIIWLRLTDIPGPLSRLLPVRPDGHLSVTPAGRIDTLHRSLYLIPFPE
ncbi:hypothetical protein YC2023_037889 [Brassica napus]